MQVKSLPAFQTFEVNFKRKNKVDYKNTISGFLNIKILLKEKLSFKRKKYQDLVKKKILP